MAAVIANSSPKPPAISTSTRWWIGLVLFIITLAVAPRRAFIWSLRRQSPAGPRAAPAAEAA